MKGEMGSSFDDNTLLVAVIILFLSILTKSCISYTTLCLIKCLSYMSSIGQALAATLCCVLAMDDCVFHHECFGWYHILLYCLCCAFAVDPCVVTVSNFEHRTVCMKVQYYTL
jgi:hypothetical protein